MNISLSLARILELVGPASVAGARAVPVTAIAGLAEAGPGDLSFLGNPKYTSQVARSKAGVILLPEDHLGEPCNGQVFLRVKNPSYALALICAEIERVLWPKPTPGIHPSAVIAADVVLGEDVHVGPLVVIGSGAVVGAHTVLQAKAYIGNYAKVGSGCFLKPGSHVGDYCELGDRVILQPGAVVGADGFGYETISGEHRRIPQVGKVVLEDDVEIGANATLDRARFSFTRVGKGTKIDNLVQIAHNVTIGRHCLVVAQAGIAGSTTLGDYVVVGGQVGLAGHLHIGSRAKIGAQAGVLSDVDEGAVMLDSPALPFGLAKRLMVLKQRIPDLFKKVETIEKQLAATRGEYSSP